jgi:hypothetical protein
MNVLKNIFGIVVVLIFLGASFFFLVLEGGMYQDLFTDNQATSTASGTMSADSMDVVEDLRRRLVDLESVSIDTAFLKSEGFEQLVNNRFDTPKLEGRKDNPFVQ